MVRDHKLSQAAEVPTIGLLYEFEGYIEAPPGLLYVLLLRPRQTLGTGIHGGFGHAWIVIADAVGPPNPSTGRLPSCSS